MQKVITVLLILLFSFIITEIKAQIANTSDNLIALPVADRFVEFDYFGEGVSKPVIWGMDAGGWTNYGIWELGKRYLGVENVKITRIPAFPGDTLVNGTELNQWQKDWILDRLNQAKTGSDGNPLQIMLNPGGADDNDLWYREDWSRYALLMKLAKDYIESFGHTVVSITGFNEPDVWYAPATMEDDYNLFQACRNNPALDGVRLCGGNTLNPDFAFEWYNYVIPAGANEGNTHQLAGTFDNYAGFYEAVKANGHYATNDEVHDIMEAIVGAEYGMQAAIYWGYANLARGEFVKACNGVRLGYAEHRPNWTAAAVYRQTDGKVQAFLGGSERQATTTTYSFISKDRPVFFEGEGPMYTFIKELPGGSGYQTTDQYFAERVFNVTWGEDIQPVVKGTYQLVNRKSGQVMEVADDSNEANVYQAASSGIPNQQWTITQNTSKYGNDASYYHIRPGSSTTRRLDLFNYSWDNGGKISLWSDGGNSNQQWYFEYIEDGYFYIRSRESTLCIQVDESGNVVQWEKTGDAGQQWRLIPIDAAVEFDAPFAPKDLVATAQSASVKLEWTSNSESDLGGYSIFRSESSSGPYYTIARSVTGSSFVDNNAQEGVTYFYVIKAVDKSLNRSAYSNEVSGTISFSETLVAHYLFDENIGDATLNINNCVSNGEISFSGDGVNGSLIMNGSNTYLRLPENIANHQEITIATWVNWAGGGTKQSIFDFSNSLTQRMALTPNTGSSNMQFTLVNGNDELTIDAPVLPLNEWVHVAVTLGLSGVHLYLNGEVVAQGTTTTSPLDFKPVMNYIGQSQLKTSLFKGNIDDFRIYNYEISPTAVQELAAAELTLSTDFQEQPEVLVYPNPTRDLLNITISSYNRNLNVQITDLSGNTILHKKIFSGQNSIDLSTLIPGIYMLRLEENSKVVKSKKIVVQ